VLGYQSGEWYTAGLSRHSRECAHPGAVGAWREKGVYVKFGGGEGDGEEGGGGEGRGRGT